MPTPTPHRRHAPSLDLLQLLQELVLLLDPDLATFLTVFGPLVQHCPVANLSWSHPTTGFLTPAGGAEVVSLSFLAGPLPHPPP